MRPEKLIIIVGIVAALITFSYFSMTGRTSSNPIVSVTVNPTSAAGTVTRNTAGPYHLGDVIVFTASPSTGYAFSSWTGNGVSAGSTFTVTVNGDMSVTATFVKNSDSPPSIKPTILWWGTDYNELNEPHAVAYLKEIGYSVIQIAPFDTKELTRDYLTKFDLIVSMGNHRMCTDNEKQAIKNYVNNGGNLILGCDTEMDRPTHPEDDLAHQFGFDFQGDNFLTIKAVPGQTNHPIWQAMSPKTTIDHKSDGYIATDNPLLIVGIGDTTPAIIDTTLGSGRVIGIGFNAFLDLIFSAVKVNLFFDYMTA